MKIQDAILHGRNNNKLYIKRKALGANTAILINDDCNICAVFIKDVLADDWECFSEEDVE